MTEVRVSGFKYQYFNDADAVTDAGAKPPAGRLMVNCPKCGNTFAKPRGINYLPDGTPKCIMQKK